MPHIDLLELPYFEGISFDELVGLVELMQPASYELGEVMVEEGDERPQPLFIVTSGRVLITKRTPNGRTRHLAELESPTLFGEVELFCDIPAVCSARALEQVSAFTLDQLTFARLLAKHTPALMRFTFNVARVACHRLAIADELFASVAGSEDLVALRRAVWARMSGGGDWQQLTGAFRLVDLPPKK